MRRHSTEREATPHDSGVLRRCDEGGVLFGRSEGVSVWEAPHPSRTMLLSAGLKEPPLPVESSVRDQLPVVSTQVAVHAI